MESSYPLPNLTIGAVCAAVAQPITPSQLLDSLQGYPKHHRAALQCLRYLLKEKRDFLRSYNRDIEELLIQFPNYSRS